MANSQVYMYCLGTEVGESMLVRDGDEYFTNIHGVMFRKKVCSSGTAVNISPIDTASCSVRSESLKRDESDIRFIKYHNFT